jgi:hypothetical protein
MWWQSVGLALFVLLALLAFEAPLLQGLSIRVDVATLALWICAGW